jgi:hypothetical protein
LSLWLGPACQHCCQTGNFDVLVAHGRQSSLKCGIRDEAIAAAVLRKPAL